MITIMPNFKAVHVKSQGRFSAVTIVIARASQFEIYDLPKRESLKFMICNGIKITGGLIKTSEASSQHPHPIFTIFTSFKVDACFFFHSG